MGTRVPEVRSRQYPLGRKLSQYELHTRYGGVGFADPEPLREHLLSLIDLGLSANALARDAGVGTTCIDNIINLRGARVGIRQAYALRAVTWRPNPNQGNVLAIGSARRLRALHAIGWTWKLIAEHSGVNKVELSKIARPTTIRRTIAWAVWDAIRRSYDALSGTANTAGRATAARLHAQRNGWPAPLDWEGHDIDDPRITVVAQPWEPKTPKELAAERRERVAELTERGLSAAEIADRVGVTQRTVVRDRVEAGVAAA